MTNGVDFDTYLKSKKIDSDAFRTAEPEVWGAWKRDFDEMHPNSFTVQKLNLINPVRRKYLLHAMPESKPAETPPAPPRPGKPVMGKPLIKPRINPDLPGEG